MNYLQKSLFSLLIIVIPGLLVIGCGTQDDDLVLAKVGPDKITAKLLNEIFERDAQPFNSFEEELAYRKQILDSLIIQQLLIQEAYKKNLDASEEVNRLVLANKDKFLLDILYLREIEDKISVSDEEIRDLYNKLEYKLQVSHILLPTEDSALIILDSLKAGGNFEDLAMRYSADPSARQNRGDIGYITWGKVTMPFLEAVFSMNPGEVSRPFETAYGWHIAKVVDRAPNEERKSYEIMKDQLEEDIRNGFRLSLMDSFLTAVQEKYPVTVDEATIDYLMHKRKSLYPQQLLETMPKNDFDLDQLDRHEKELVLATWDGGQLTLGQYLTLIKQQKPELRPNLDDTRGIATFIFQQNIMDLLAVESRRRGLEDDPEYKRKIKRFKELTMADIMENDSLPIYNPPTEEDLEKYYNDNISQFEVPARIHVYEIMFPTEKMARENLKSIKSLRKFKEVAGELTERPGKRELKGDLGNIQQRFFPELYALAEKNPVGAIAGPVEVNGKFSIIYVADKQAAEIRDFQQVERTIQSRLEAERRQESLQRWVEEKKKDVDVEVYENNLRPGIDKDKYATTG